MAGFHEGCSVVRFFLLLSVLNLLGCGTPSQNVAGGGLDEDDSLLPGGRDNEVKVGGFDDELDLSLDQLPGKDPEQPTLQPVSPSIRAATRAIPRIPARTGQTRTIRAATRAIPRIPALMGRTRAIRAVIPETSATMSRPRPMTEPSRHYGIAPSTRGNHSARSRSWSGRSSTRTTMPQQVGSRRSISWLRDSGPNSTAHSRTRPSPSMRPIS